MARDVNQIVKVTVTDVSSGLAAASFQIGFIFTEALASTVFEVFTQADMSDATKLATITGADEALAVLQGGFSQRRKPAQLYVMGVSDLVGTPATFYAQCISAAKNNGVSPWMNTLVDVTTADLQKDFMDGGAAASSINIMPDDDESMATIIDTNNYPNASNLYYNDGEVGSPTTPKAVGALFAILLTKAIGSVNPDNNEVRGIISSIIADVSTLDSLNSGYVTEIGTMVTQNVKTGLGQPLEIPMIKQWLSTRITERVYNYMVNVDKSGYTQQDFDEVGKEIAGVLEEGQRNNAITPTQYNADKELIGGFEIKFPNPEDISQADKLAKVFKGTKVHCFADIGWSVIEIEVTLDI